MTRDHFIANQVIDVGRSLWLCLCLSFYTQSPGTQDRSAVHNVSISLRVRRTRARGLHHSARRQQKCVRVVAGRTYHLVGRSSTTRIMFLPYTHLARAAIARAQSRRSRRASHIYTVRDACSTFPKTNTYTHGEHTHNLYAIDEGAAANKTKATQNACLMHLTNTLRI